MSGEVYDMHKGVMAVSGRAEGKPSKSNSRGHPLNKLDCPASPPTCLLRNSHCCIFVHMPSFFLPHVYLFLKDN